MKTPTPPPSANPPATLPGFQLPGKGRPPLLWDPALLQSSVEVLIKLPDLFGWYRAAVRHLVYGLVQPHIPRIPAMPIWAVPMLDEARRQVQASLSAQMDAVFMTAFPQYRLEDLQAMSLEALLELYAHAEWSIQQIRGIPLQLVGPDGQPIGNAAPMPPGAGSGPQAHPPPQAAPPFPPAAPPTPPGMPMQGPPMPPR